MKKLLYPIALILTAFVFIYSCSAEEEDTTPPPTVQQPTPEPEPEVSQFTLTVTAGEGGTVSTEGGTYDEGTEVTFTATAEEGYIFSHWSNDLEVSNITINVNSNLELKANFIAEDVIDDGFYILVGTIVENTQYYDDSYKIVFKYENNSAVFTGKVYDDLASFPIFKDMGYIPGEPDDLLTNKMVGRGLIHREYFIGDNRQSLLLSKIDEDEIPNKLTHNEIMSLVEGKGFWSDPIYSKIDPLDPKSYVVAFIKDAERHGVDLSFVDLDEVSITFRDSGYAGLSHLSCIDDNRVDISYLQAFWNSASYYDIVNERLTVMYHELGHDILNSNHPANGELKQFMNQGLGESGNIVWDDSNEMFSFRRMVDDMFSGVGLNYTCGNGAKNYSRTSSKSYFYTNEKNISECFTPMDTTQIPSNPLISMP